MTIFEHWKDITQTKNVLEEESSYQPYMITRFVSMVNAYMDMAVEVNKYDLPKEVHHEFFRCVLPKRFTKFDYLKKKKEDVDNKILIKYFEFGSRDLKLAEKLMEENDIAKIKRKYGGKE